MIAIIDFGVSNVSSVANMIKKVGGESTIVNDHDELKNIGTNKIILPGVGSFDVAVSLLHDGGWINELNKFIEQPKNKLLGICLGMQLLFEGSEEGKLPGLGWITGNVKKFNFNNNKLKVPHMGWNIVKASDNSRLFESDELEKRFYFVHSYYANCVDENDIAATCNYGFDFTCAIEKNNILGVQFHPEKSHRFGMELMKKFIEL